MVSQCGLINISANSTVPNFAWNFLPLTVALKMSFHNPGTKVTSAKQRKGLELDRLPLAHSGARKATQQGCVQRAEGKGPGNFMLGFFPGLTLYIHPQLPMSQSKAETAWRGCRPATGTAAHPARVLFSWQSPAVLPSCPPLLSPPHHPSSCFKQPEYSLPERYLLRGLKTWQNLGYAFTEKVFFKGKTLLWATDML